MESNKVDVRGVAPKVGDIILIAKYGRIHPYIFIGFGSGSSVQHLNINHYTLEFFEGKNKWSGKSYTLCRERCYIIVDDSVLDLGEQELYKKIKAYL